MPSIIVAGVNVSGALAQDELDGLTIGTAAWQGEQGTGNVLIPDPTGTAEYYVGQSVQIKDGTDVLIDGFVAGQQRVRGRSTGSRRLDQLTVVDPNALLYGFRARAWVRPAETDRARVLAYKTAFLPAIVSTTWVLNTNTVNLPAKTYSTDDLTSELLHDCNARVDKTLYIVNRELHYHKPMEGPTCPYSIHDTATPSATVWPPYNPARTKEGGDLRNDIVATNGKLDASASDATSIGRHDAGGLKHQATVEVPDATSAELVTIAARMLAEAKAERYTYSVRIGLLTSAQAVAMVAGQVVTVTSQLLGLSSATLRISRLTLEYQHPEGWWADLELDRPIRIPRPVGGGLQSFVEPVPSNTVRGRQIPPKVITEEMLDDFAVSARALQNDIPGTKLLDDSIESPKLKAKSITTLQLAVGAGNMAEDASFEYQPQATTKWTLGSGWSVTDTGGRTGPRRATFTGISSGTIRNAALPSVSQGQKWYVEGWWLTTAGAVGLMDIGIEWLNVDGTVVSTSRSAQLSGAQTAWARTRIVAAAPVGAVQAKIAARVIGWTTGTQSLDDVLLAPLPLNLENETSTTVIDASGVTITNGALKVYTPAGLVVIDGSHLLFQIALIGSVTVPSQSHSLATSSPQYSPGTVYSAIETWSLGLATSPVVDARVLDNGWAYGFPYSRFNTAGACNLHVGGLAQNVSGSTKVQFFKFTILNSSPAMAVKYYIMDKSAV